MNIVFFNFLISFEYFKINITRDEKELNLSIIIELEKPIITVQTQSNGIFVF